MKNTKKFISTSLFVLLVLTLVSFCFVGFTFARYTSGGTGAATVNVAKWDVSDVVEGTVVDGKTTVNFGKLSPSDAKYDASAAARTHTTAPVKILTITNNSDVDAIVTMVIGDITLTTIETTKDNYNADNAKLPFSIELYATQADATNGTNPITNDIKDSTKGIKLNAKTTDTPDSKEVWAVVTWTSDNLTGIAANGDENDTMIGENVTGVSYTFTYTAVQASTKPE